jgi:hypothetical protein
MNVNITLISNFKSAHCLLAFRLSLKIKVGRSSNSKEIFKKSVQRQFILYENSAMASKEFLCPIEEFTWWFY